MKFGNLGIDDNFIDTYLVNNGDIIEDIESTSFEGKGKVLLDGKLLRGGKWDDNIDNIFFREVA